jgi:hypothetical protein
LQDEGDQRAKKHGKSIGGWPTQARCWLEWGSSTAGQRRPAALSRFLAAHSDSISTHPSHPVAYWRKLLHSSKRSLSGPPSKSGLNGMRAALVDRP